MRQLLKMTFQVLNQLLLQYPKIAEMINLSFTTSGLFQFRRLNIKLIHAAIFQPSELKSVHLYQLPYHQCILRFQWKTVLQNQGLSSDWSSWHRFSTYSCRDIVHIEQNQTVLLKFMSTIATIWNTFVTTKLTQSVTFGRALAIIVIEMFCDWHNTLRMLWKCANSPGGFKLRRFSRIPNC